MTDAERAAFIANMSPDQRAAYLASLSFSFPPPLLSLSVHARTHTHVGKRRDLWAPQPWGMVGVDV